MQKTGGPILTICTSYDVLLRKEFNFGVSMIAPALKFLVASFLQCAALQALY